MESIHTEKMSHFKIEIFTDPDPMNPMEYDELGTMYLFHNRYNLGHKHDLSVEEVQNLIKSPDVFSLPVFAYEHGGITISTGPYSCIFDSGQLGVIAITREKIMKEYGNCNPETIELVYKNMKAEIQSYDDFLTGNCYGYRITDIKTKEDLDSCWGFLGDYESNALTEARESAQYYIDKEES